LLFPQVKGAWGFVAAWMAARTRRCLGMGGKNRAHVLLAGNGR
jgi:hypothetical protein